MNRLIYLLQVILVVFVVDCNSRSYKNDQNDCSSREDSSECDSDNEVDNDSVHDAEESTERSGKIDPHTRNRTEWKVIDFTTAKRGVTTVKTVITATTIANASCMYHYNMNQNRSDEDEEEAKSTLIDYPFAVSIQKKGSHYVSGALIDKRWILSVAGEFYTVRESLKLYKARLGSVDCKKGGTVVPIKKIEIHPYYVHGKPNFDLSLLRMALPVDYTDVIRPIGISNVKGKVLSAKFMTTYWPRILIKGQIIPVNAKERVKYNSMRVSTQRLIPVDQCTKIMAAVSEALNEASLCLKPVVTHHSVCMPDAGAPVVADDGLWGITSGWIAATCPNYAAPTIFTRLSSTSVRSWLDTQLLSV